MIQFMHFSLEMATLATPWILLHKFNSASVFCISNNHLYIFMEHEYLFKSDKYRFKFGIYHASVGNFHLITGIYDKAMQYHVIKELCYWFMPSEADD